MERFYYICIMEKFRKEIKLPVKDKQDLKMQALLEGYNSMKDMIEQKTLSSLDEFREKENKSGSD